MLRFDDILEKVTPVYKEKEINLLKKAYVFAARAHKGQTRRSGEPYLSHPLEVANMLADMKLDSTTLVAGLLHDVLEDTDVTIADLQQAFGDKVAHLVEGVTKISRMEESTPERRQAETIRKIILAMTDDLRVIFIKLADRIHNLKTLKFLPDDKQKQIAEETLEIYAPIANRLGMGRIKAELEDLSFRYVDPENYFKIASLVDPLKKEAEAELKKIGKTLEDLMNQNNIPAQIFYRIKRLYSIYHKMRRQQIDFNQVFDFMALRLITDSVNNCYSALGIIHQKWPHIPHRFRDFIAMPKPNLYQSLHTTIITEKKQTVEIQIRTHEMHNLAENGISAHWKYKEKDPHAILQEDKRLYWLREMVELYKEQKNPQQFLKSLKNDLVPEEIYVFTPKGEVITLPLGASALDFAFKIHSELGMHARAAKINGREAPLKNILQPGDIVEILTSEDVTPAREWLNMVSTSKARHHIKRWLNQQEKIKKSALGRKLWERQLKKYNLSAETLEEESLLQSVAKATNFRLKSWDEFYSCLGYGKIILNRKILEKLFPSLELESKKEPLYIKMMKKVSGKGNVEVEVRDPSGLSLRLAKCCSPVKGEPITGYITSGKGITVHALRCPLIKKEILDSLRMIEVSWGVFSGKDFKARLLIRSEDTPGVLAKLSSAIAHLGGNITKAEVLTFEDKKAELKIALRIRDIKVLESIIRKISRIKEINSVERI